MKQTKTIYCILAAVLLLVSCKSDEDYWTPTLYGDAAIKTVTLGKVNRYIDGEKFTIDASSYAMQVNALTHVVENTDSLPIYTDAAHIVCSIATVNNGTAYIKSLTEEIFTLYNPADSIDFRQPRTFRIVSSDNSGHNDYTIKINVHKQDGDQMVWKMEPLSPWITPNPAGMKQYLGDSSYEEYALSMDGDLMAKRKDGVAWVQDLSEDNEDIDHFPTQDIALTCYPMTMADSIDYVLLVGTRDGKTAVWRKVVDNSNKDPLGFWSYMNRNSDTIGLLPALTNLSIVYYDGVVLAFGGDYKTIYESRDNGITWKVSSRITMPLGFEYDNIDSMTVYVDDENFLWLCCTTKDGIDVIWKGRLNRLGWEK